MQRLVQDIRKLERASSAYSGLCVLVMMVCVSFTARNLFIRITPDWNLDYLPWLTGFAALEALVSQRYLMRPSHLITNGRIYRFAELVFIFLVTRLVTLPWWSLMDVRLTLSSWKDDLLENFFDAQFLLALLVVIMIWAISILFAQDLADQEGDELALQNMNMKSLVSDRIAAQQRLAGRVFAVGGVLVFLNGLLRQETFDLFEEVGIQKQDMWHVIMYFIAGLVLQSLSQLANRRLAWAWERLSVRTDLPHKWITASLIFILLVFLIALTIPTAYSDRFLPGLGNILGVVLSFLYGLALLILTPIFYIFGWLMSLFKADQRSQPIEPFQPPPLFPAEALAPVIPPAWMALIKSILIWATLLAATSYLLHIYFGQNKQVITRIRSHGGFRWLKVAWMALVNWFRRIWSSVHVNLLSGIHRRETGFRQRVNVSQGLYLNLRRLNPRQKVFFYYLALLRRSGDANSPRSEWQTPHEYDHFLGMHFPEVKPEITSMTELFMEARYSRHTIADSQVNSIRAAWQQVRKLLRSQRSRSK